MPHAIDFCGFCHTPMEYVRDTMWQFSMPGGRLIFCGPLCLEAFSGLVRWNDVNVMTEGLRRIVV